VAESVFHAPAFCKIAVTIEDLRELIVFHLSWCERFTPKPTPTRYQTGIKFFCNARFYWPYRGLVAGDGFEPTTFGL
jgi:hypothetical protein